MRQYVICRITCWFLIVWFPCFLVAPTYAQFDDEYQEDLFSDEHEEGDLLDEPAEEEQLPEVKEEQIEQEPEITQPEITQPEITEPEVKEEVVTEPVIEEPQIIPEVVEPVFEEEERPAVLDEGKVSLVQNAVLEGVQISKEPGESPDESIITGYFIFRDKPSNYFYEVKKKQKLIEFEFDDVVEGSSPIASVEEPPIKGFKIESRKIDKNKDVVGLNPEWHDVIKVTFRCDAVPKINVKDEYSIISFSFRWSTKEDKAEIYTDNDRNRKPLLFVLLGTGAALGGLGAYLFLKPNEDDTERKPLEGIEGVINHPIPLD